MSNTIKISKNEFINMIHEMLFIRDMNQQLRQRLLITNAIILWYNEFFIWYQSLNSIISSISPNAFLLAQSLLDLFPKLSRHLLDEQKKYQKEIHHICTKFFGFVTNEKIKFDLYEHNINESVFDEMYSNIVKINEFWDTNRNNIIKSRDNLLNSQALFIYKNVPFNEIFREKFNLFAQECNLNLSAHEFFYTAVCSEFVWRLIRTVFLKAKIPLIDYDTSDFITNFDTSLHLIIEKVSKYWDKRVNVVCEPFKFVIDSMDKQIEKDMITELDVQRKVMFENLPDLALDVFYKHTFKQDNSYMTVVKQKYIDLITSMEPIFLYNFKCSKCTQDIKKNEKLYLNKEYNIVCMNCDKNANEFPVQDIHASNVVFQQQNFHELLKTNNYLINISLFCEEDNLLSRYLTNTKTENLLLRNILKLLVMKLIYQTDKFGLEPLVDYTKALLAKLN